MVASTLLSVGGICGVTGAGAGGGGFGTASFSPTQPISLANVAAPFCSFLSFWIGGHAFLT